MRTVNSDGAGPAEGTQWFGREVSAFAADGRRPKKQYQNEQQQQHPWQRHKKQQNKLVCVCVRARARASASACVFGGIDLFLSFF